MAQVRCRSLAARVAQATDNRQGAPGLSSSPSSWAYCTSNWKTFMLPKNVETPRGRYLQTIVDNASATNFAGWPMLNQTDYVLVGGLVVLYSHIDLDLRRV